jgi:hypothetical protein
MINPVAVSLCRYVYLAQAFAIFVVIISFFKILFI